MTDEEKRIHAFIAKERRDGLAEQNLCINGASHGLATHGTKCAWCAAVHKFGAVVAFRMGIARPPNHRVTKRLRAESDRG